MPCGAVPCCALPCCALPCRALLRRIARHSPSGRMCRRWAAGGRRGGCQYIGLGTQLRPCHRTISISTHPHSSPALPCALLPFPSILPSIQSGAAVETASGQSWQTVRARLCWPLHASACVAPASAASREYSPATFYRAPQSDSPRARGRICPCCDRLSFSSRGEQAGVGWAAGRTSWRRTSSHGWSSLAVPVGTNDRHSSAVDHTDWAARTRTHAHLQHAHTHKHRSTHTHTHTLHKPKHARTSTHPDNARRKCTQATPTHTGRVRGEATRCTKRLCISKAAARMRSAASQSPQERCVPT